ncbi:transcriptional regulator domain-containing protein [Hoeflea sp.]|uniref:transcriptional regulator domain-containing protein n=1 Tax=Hoeflea sp. TaxID=1940281 RepID=UPI003B01FC43
MNRDWRNEDDYAYFDDLDASGLAWECLRRNRAYRAAFAAMTEAEAGTWELRFPGRSGS